MGDDQLLRIWKQDGQWRFDGHPGYETRRSSIETLIRACDQDNPLPDFKHPIVMQLGDQPSPKADLAFSYDPDTAAMAHILPAPDFIFDHWKQVGIDNFSTTCQEISTASSKSALLNKAGWIGSFNTHPIRSKLGQLAQSHPLQLEAYDTGRWTTPTTDKPGRLTTTKQPFMSLDELARRYAYLIDVEGYGYSGRLKLLLHSRRPVLLQQRRWQEYYFQWMQPYVHYVPVKADLSDLISRIEWLQTHPERAQQIADRAYDFSQRYLTTEFAKTAWRFLIARLRPNSLIAYTRSLSVALWLTTLFLLVWWLIMVWLLNLFLFLPFLEKPSKRLDIVVSHFEESLAWLTDIPLSHVNRIFVYHKGKPHQDGTAYGLDKQTTLFSCLEWKVLPNVGRESHTIASHCRDICLTKIRVKETHHTLFLQGKIEDHLITESNPWNYVYPMQQVQRYLMHDYVSGTRHMYQNRGYVQHSEPYASQLARNEMQRANVPFAVYFQHMLGRPMPVSGIWINFTNMFSVKNTRIFAHSLNVYSRLVDSLANHSNPETGHYFERLSRSLFGGSTSEFPDERFVSCS